MKLEISDEYHEYIFVLTPESVLLCQYRYKTSNQTSGNYSTLTDGDYIPYFEQTKVTLNDIRLKMINGHLKQALNDIAICSPGRHLCINTDNLYYVEHYPGYHQTIYSENETATFCYGASKSPDINILTEIIIGCSDFEADVLDYLNPITKYKRNWAKF